MELEWNGEREKRENKEKNKTKYTENKVKTAGEVYTGGVNSEEEKMKSRLGMQSRYSKQFLENLTWLTSNEAANYLRLPSVGALRVLVCKRRVPFHKLGRSLRFKRVELDRLLEASKHLGGF